MDSRSGRLIVLSSPHLHAEFTFMTVMIIEDSSGRTGVGDTFEFGSPMLIWSGERGLNTALKPFTFIGFSTGFLRPCFSRETPALSSRCYLALWSCLSSVCTACRAIHLVCLPSPPRLPVRRELSEARSQVQTVDKTT